MASRKPSKGKRLRTRPRPARAARAQRAEPALADPVVVGIGASAGGLEALRSLLGAAPAKTGLAFVVVVHLDPTHESLMPQLLAKSTSLVVEQASDGQALEAEHVYVVPPNRSLTLDGAVIRLQRPEDRSSLRGTVDRFLRSLAQAQGHRAIGVVLSGTGTEGTLGAQAIKAEGGLVIAQAPDTATQPGMPSSAIASGAVDLVLAPDKMARALLDYANTRRFWHAQSSLPAEGKPPEGLQAILAVLRARRKHDFRGYKKGTLQRRVERRMGLQQIATLPRYVEFLRSHPAEVDALFRDLLIGVTSFFRDPAAFDELAKKVWPDLVKDRDPDAPIRVWVPGCATGEEAYSLAIVIAEQLAAAKAACGVQIFATDVDDGALQVARTGSYPESIALDVSPARLQRFFTHEDHRYTVAKSIRESVVFAVQNLISDPPFSKMDLVSCRNVLIYLEPEVQQRLMTVFHFSLNPGGYLFLGSAEGIGALEGLFAPISKRQRIFKRVGPASRVHPQMLPPQVARAEEPSSAKLRPEEAIGVAADRQLLARLAPTAVVVRRDGRIVRFYGAMQRYINLPKGEATLDLVALARDSLKPTLRAALHDATGRRRPVVLEVPEPKRDRSATLRISVAPLAPRTAEDLWLVVFDEQPAPAPSPGRAAPSRQPDLGKRLEAELRALKREHRQLTEELESGNEELRAANEEILSMNEELQSTNEELVTSKEELQSMNEELTTLNAQLQEKVQELTGVNDDLANLLASGDIGTLLLDSELRIKRFTVGASQVLNLQPSDVGRPLNHIASNLLDVDLAGEARAMLRGPAPLEKEVGARDGKRYLVRGLPYRAQDKSVQGVVLTLVDVTAMKQIELDLRRAEDELQRLNQALENRVAERTRQITLLHAVTRAIADAATWDDALRGVVREICQAGHWRLGHVYLPDPRNPDVVTLAIASGSDGQFRTFRALSERQRFARGVSLPGRVYAEQKPVWGSSARELKELLPLRGKLAMEAGLQSAVALPVWFGSEIIAVLELFSDDPHAPSEEITALMSDISSQIGRVLERERSTAQMADLVWGEQQALLHTLHDALGQTLTGLGMLGAGLSQRLGSGDVGGAAELAHQISEEARRALEQVRSLARGLFPTAVEPDALTGALRELAATTQSIHGVRVDVEGDEHSSIRDGNVATQLYRIAQEAVTNAVKHGRPRNIKISLRDGNPAELSVSDDGVGIRNSDPNADGMGLRIMQHRAASIGARLAVGPGARGGTVVTCTVRPGILGTQRRGG